MLYLKMYGDIVIFTEYAADADYILLEAQGESHHEFEDKVDNLITEFGFKPTRLSYEYNGIGVYVIKLASRFSYEKYSQTYSLTDSNIAEFEYIDNHFVRGEDGRYRFK